jgi:RNA polymerase sigma factor (sigma-70 family)
MVEDAELLRRYTEQGSQESFAELVRRHLALVYFGALRRTADAGLAADVSQIVFVSLAKNARALRSHSALCAWLFTATRNAAINARAAEERRRKREQEALLMHETSATETASVEWDRLRPLLHEALDALSDQDRRAVLLRFFQERSFAEIGRTLRLTEDAARKRVDRALGTLETALSRRGVTSTAAAITGALTAEALAVPPVALLGTIPAAAVAAAAGSAGSLIVFVTMSKIKLGVIGAITAAGLTTVLVQIQTSRALAADLRQARTGVQRFVALQKENEILNGQLAKTTSATDRAELDRLRKQIAAVKMQPA